MLYFLGIGVVLDSALLVGHLLALQHLVDAKSYYIQPLIMGQTGGQGKDLSLIGPADLEVK
jgi:hypothetical protein